MRLRPWAILLTIPLWSCASKPDGNAQTGSSAPSESSGATKALGVIETPLFVAFKIPGCLVSAPLLGPGALVSAIIPFKDTSKGTGWQVVPDGVAEACGPPWVATPH